ncbi:MAG: hypothetical protein WCT10_05125 [Patescibacteria group bacterium]|jgi:hypothetical protein
MFGPLELACSLYKRLLSSSNIIRQDIDPFLKQIRENGAIPLGCRYAADGELEYCWLIYRRNFAVSTAELAGQLRDLSPPHAKLVLIFL